MPRGTLNKVQLIGIVGRDPDIKFVGQSNMKMCTFSLVTNEGYKDKQSNEWVDKPEWHKIVCYKNVAELCEQYISKGSKVYLEGKLETKKFTDKSGIERLSTSIVMSRIEFISASKKKTNQQPQSNENAYQQDYNQDFNDDVPF